MQGWASKTPEGFVFAAKIPQVITHEKVLVDCDAEFKQFMEVMDILGEKLGPLLFQFGYFNRKVFRRRERLPRSAPTVPEETAERSQVRGRNPKQELARAPIRRGPARTRRCSGPD